MIRACLLLPGTLILGAMASNASAQQDMTPLPNNQAEVELSYYADCVVRKAANRANVAAFLRVAPDSEGFFPAAMKAADMRCLDDAAMKRRTSKLEMRLQPATFRQALFPALYRAQFGKAAPPALSSLPALTYTSEFENGGAGLPEAYRGSRALGDCVARATPQGAHALLTSRPYSKQEDAAVETIKPALAQCLSQGQTVRFSRSSLRAYVGEATYRLAVAAQSSPPAPTG